jgi:hypothetical protein
MIDFSAGRVKFGGRVGGGTRNSPKTSVVVQIHWSPSHALAQNYGGCGELRDIDGGGYDGGWVVSPGIEIENVTTVREITGLWV